MLVALYRKARALLGTEPISRLFTKLQQDGFQVQNAHVLELFAGNGRWQTYFYRHRVKGIDAFEIDPELAEQFRRNIRGGRAIVTDTYLALERPERRYEIVISDNTISRFGPDGRYCEHFDLFPAVLNALADDAVLILNVVTDTGLAQAAPFRFAVDATHLARRSLFYGVERPEQIPVEQMVLRYRALADEGGFYVATYTVQRRHVVSLLALRLKRKTAS